MPLLKAGVSGIVPKRAMGEELIDAIRIIMEGEKYLHPKIASAVMDEISTNKSKTKIEGDLTEREIEVLRLEIPPGKRICTEDLSTGSDECIYVVEGQLEYRYGNDSVRIEKGGSIYIPRKTGHYIFNPGEAPAVILWAIRSAMGGRCNE